MNPVTRKYMQLLSRIQINDRSNEGIVWHAGNKPHAQATHFIGNASGNTAELNLNTASANITAAQVAEAMKEHIRMQARVRRIRYIMNLTGGATQVDQTQVGMVSTKGVDSEMGDIAPLFGPGDDISLQTFTDYYEKLRLRYVARYRNTTTTLTDTICHSNCHSSCYAARNRR